MPSMRIRWSEQEARKPYARPFMVTFTGDDGSDVGSVALNGADLLYYTQFQTAVLSLAGELFVDPEVEGSADPQRTWLDRIASLMPAIGAITITPRSTFDDNQGRVFRLVITAEGGRAILAAAGPEPAGFAFLAQEIDADDYRGRTVTFRGELRTAKGDGRAGLVHHRHHDVRHGPPREESEARVARPARARGAARR